MRYNAPAEFAEVLVSPDYRATLDAAFEASPEHFHEQEIAAQDIIFNAIKHRSSTSDRAWEVRRQAALAELGDTDLGAFNDYIQGLGGKAAPSELLLTDLEAGKPEIVRINSRIMASNRLYEEPIDFLESALDIINTKPGSGRLFRGPENYATAIKFFANKYEEFPSTHLSKTTIKELVDRTMEGFLEVAQKDKPNFVEMTNMYYAMRTLPRGSFDKKFTADILTHSLEQLPTYNSRTLAILLAAVAKLDVSEMGETAATLVDLTMRKGKKFETTSDMRQALRAISNLPQTAAANRTFATFLEVRNNLEEPLDMDGIMETNERLLYIVSNVIDDPDLTLQAKEVAHTSAKRAIQLLQRAQHLGDVTTSQLTYMKETVARIVNNCNAI